LKEHTYYSTAVETVDKKKTTKISRYEYTFSGTPDNEFCVHMTLQFDFLCLSVWVQASQGDVGSSRAPRVELFVLLEHLLQSGSVDPERLILTVRLSLLPCLPAEVSRDSLVEVDMCLKFCLVSPFSGFTSILLPLISIQS